MAPSLTQVDLFDLTQFATFAQLLRLRGQPRSLVRSQILTGTYPPPLQFTERKSFFLLPEHRAWEFERLPDDRDRDRARTTKIRADRRALLRRLLAAVDKPTDHILEELAAFRDLHVPRALKSVCTESLERPTLNRLPISYHEALARIEADRVLGVDLEFTDERWFVDMRALIRRNIECVDCGFLKGSTVDASI